MRITSLVLGILSFLGMFIGLVPCLGALNWIVIPLSLIGLIISVMSYREVDEKPKGIVIAGIVMCGLALVFGTIRLIAGGGIV